MCRRVAAGRRIAVLACAAGWLGAAPARSPDDAGAAEGRTYSARGAELVAVDFHVRHATAPGESVYVLGSLPELGGDHPAFALKLRPEPSAEWGATVLLPAGRDFTYQYATRRDAVPDWRDPRNFGAISLRHPGATQGAERRPSAKGVLYHSGWTAPEIYWRVAGGAYQRLAMRDAGAGRAAGERRWRAVLPNAAGREVEFYFAPAGGGGRDPASGAYRTRLDALFVQDGEVFSYVPPPGVDPQRQINFATFASARLGENRPYRVLLPRGYAQNSPRRYPVLYLHDGQNVFDMGPFGTWNADETAAALTSSGVLREVLMVAVDNTANRARDYITPADTVPIGPGAGGPGRADRYARFLIEELRPAIDAAYRTLTDRESTAALGSSLGGTVTMYLGWDHGAVFGRVAVFSGAWWATPNQVARMQSEPYRPLRIYLDSGDTGSGYDDAARTMAMRDLLLSRGWRLRATLTPALSDGPAARGAPGDLWHVVGYGHQHNEAAWAARLPLALAYLFPASEEPGTLDREIFRGDVNCDGAVNFDDIDGFVFALVGRAAYEAGVAGCRWEYADANGDGAVDFEDIDAFAQALAG